ncbi:MAG: B-box zinc finger protein [Acidobacteria bacterium]|nr:B-box zinc finger protein [Acidobacteriota bacterium]
MNCSYHTENAAVVNCNGCGKPLCPSCDHRIKGFPYCQDCIVEGVELLRNRKSMAYVPIVRKQTSPFISTVLSLFCPGLGAAYNGQTSKALIHFLVFIGLFQMAILSGGMAVFVLGFLGMWLYAALDSWRTAQMIRSGVTPNSAEDVLVQRFSGNAKLWGIVLTIIGVSFVLQTLFNFNQILTRFILPLLLIGLGIHLLRAYLFKSNSSSDLSGFYRNNRSLDYPDSFREPEYSSEKFDLSDDFQTHVRNKNWK